MTIAGVADATAFNQLLTEFASSILPDLLYDEEHHLWSSLGGFRDDADYTDDEAEILEMLVDYLKHFVSTFHLERGVVRVSISSDNDSQDLLEAIANFLLPYATDPYVLICGASLSNYGGTFDQSLLYRSGGRTVTHKVSDVIKGLFADPTALAGSLLPWNPKITPEQVLVNVPE
ncbi:hypothetical protein KQ298_09725 [Synechococcus sp. CS-1330]|nr:hypothetical protein [Synechococcus sp. CS-1330]